jgi:hydroxypyruvate isomerase
LLRFDPNLRWLFTELPMENRFAAAAAAGFRGVESAFPYAIPADDLARTLSDNGLTLVQILSPVDWDAGERGIAALPDRVDDFRAGLRTAIDYAVRVGGPFVHVLAGNIPAGLDRERCYETFVRNLDEAARLAAKEGLTIIIEPVSARRWPEFLFKRLDQGIEIINRVGRDNVKLCFDTYHVQSEEGALIEHLEATLPFIGHVQIGNPPGRNEPGAGELDLVFFLRQLERVRWDGWVGLEYTPSVSTLESLAWAEPYGIGGTLV